MTCRHSRSAPESAHGEREEYAAMMTNRVASVTRNTHMSRLEPETNMPPARMQNTSAQVT